jgi:Peptidase family M28
MKINVIVAILFLFSASNIKGQYISNVTVPDKSVPKTTDRKDPAFRYASEISASSLRDHLRILASDSLEGRETGQKGMELAADYIAKQLRNLGLNPSMSSGNYYQPVAFTYSKWKNSEMFVQGTRYRLLWDFITMPEVNKNNAIISDQEVIFLGYGIDTEIYSDYKKADVKGKIIMINKGEPTDKKGNSIITKTNETSEWSLDINRKLIAAKEKGVKLVLIIEDDIKKLLEENRRKLLSPNLQLGNLTDNELNTADHVYISTTVAKAIIGEQEKKVIKAREKYAKGKPEAVNLPIDFSINMTKDVNVLEGKNVVGYIQGKSKPDEYVIVTAHYDHLGKRGDEVFNGANDNGSGSATLLELAQSCQQAVLEGNSPERSIVFIWFCGEEKGLLGSHYYTENPVFPLQQTVVNINVDMVGRTDDKYKDNPEYIYIIGSDRLSSDLHKISEDVNNKYTQLTLDYTYNSEEDPNKYYYRSDHYNFAKNGIPAIFYFNGTHEDYHRTTDDVSKINFDAMEKVGKLIFHTLFELANRPQRIKVDGVVK